MEIKIFLIHVIGYAFIWAATDVHQINGYTDKAFNRFWFLKLALIAIASFLIKF